MTGDVLCLVWTVEISHDLHVSASFPGLTDSFSSRKRQKICFIIVAAPLLAHLPRNAVFCERRRSLSSRYSHNRSPVSVSYEHLCSARESNAATRLKMSVKCERRRPQEPRGD